MFSFENKSFLFDYSSSSLNYQRNSVEGLPWAKSSQGIANPTYFVSCIYFFCSFLVILFWSGRSRFTQETQIPNNQIFLLFQQCHIYNHDVQNSVFFALRKSHLLLIFSFECHGFYTLHLDSFWILAFQLYLRTIFLLCPLQIISGLQNFNKENVASVVTAADKVCRDSLLSDIQVAAVYYYYYYFIVI